MTATPSASTPARYTLVGLAALVALSLFGTLAVSAFQPKQVENPEDACPDEQNPAAPFEDRATIPEVHVRNVDCAFNNDITLGFTDNTFRPASSVRRDQFASFLVRMMEAGDVDLPQPEDQGFTDIDGNPHEDNINILAQTGITEGTSETRYSPRRTMPREQIGSFILRAAAFIEDVSLASLQREEGPFEDVAEGNVHRLNINGARHFNLTVGRTATTYEPSSLTRRDQMASFLIRLLASLREKGGLIEPTERVTNITFDDEDLDATNRVRTPHTATVTVTDRVGDPVEDANVRFEVYRDDAQTDAGTFSGPVESETIVTDADGRATFTYTGPATAAVDTIVACAPVAADTCQVSDEDPDTDGTQFTGEPTVGAAASATARKTWVPDIDEIVFDDEDLDAANPVATPHTVTLTATQDGEPIDGAVVRFEVYRDDAQTDAGTFSGPVEEDQTTTDADGRATFTYTGPATAAVDTIVACTPTTQGTCGVEDEDPDTAGTQFSGEPTVGAAASATARKTWQEPTGVVFDDEDLRAVNPPGAEHSASVTATDQDGQPLQGAAVRFEVYRGALVPLFDVGTTAFSGPVEEGVETTGADGRATFTYTGPAERALDLIVACVPEGGSCQVVDEDAGTQGIQFTGQPDVGAEPNATAVKIWSFEAESASASAFGARVDLLGDTLVGPTPFVEVLLPEDGRQAQEADDTLVVDLGGLGRLGLTEVFAAGDLDFGWAQGRADTADVELLQDDVTGEPLIEAQAIHTVSTSECPDPHAASPSEASEGSEFVDLTIGGVDVPINPAPNTTVTIPDVAEVTVRKVEQVANARGEEETVVQGLYIELLNEDTTITVAEARSALDCADDPT